ncbi:2-amino-4-hydroxy-6-hydroxymethyldihydropteridine diphosphokinase [Fusobacterium sp. PH5-44]|uniref:2-amino-4-hydroxy-6- hydroxymethyldihydropteridine diphosphokinase n=1 Tax=unclassified Fusobacterium TaxID=2648384 RepID=UPI003D20F519
MDKISINNLEFIGYHGVFPEEKKLGQKFLVSIEMFLSTREAAITGDLKKSVHYGEVAKDIKNIFLEKSYDLLETCAENIGKIILQKYLLVQEIKISVKKPWAPIQMNFENVSVEITRKRYKVYLSLGSNVGETYKNINSAISKLSKVSDTSIKKVSEIIETEPFGDVIQDNFLNCCIELETLLTPQEFLGKVLEIEKELGRDRKKEVKWGPRTIDIDIILYGKEVVEEENLSIPHQWMIERSFVLNPLAEIAPNIVHPLLNKTIFQLKNELDKREKHSNM